MAWFGARSFATIDSMLAQHNPAFSAQLKPLGPAATRQALHYAMVEQNAWLFRSWENFQVLLAIVFFCYLLFGTTEGKASLGVMLAMLLLTLIQRFWLSPELTLSGRVMVYIPADLALQENARFWLLHNAYLALEALKFGAGLILGAIALSRKRSVDPLNQLNMVDKAKHRHVNW